MHIYEPEFSYSASICLFCAVFGRKRTCCASLIQLREKRGNSLLTTASFLHQLALEVDEVKFFQLMGFAGYFDARLYGDCHLSIVPRNFTHGLISWFPALIPLRELYRLRAGNQVSTVQHYPEQMSYFSNQIKSNSYSATKAESPIVHDTVVHKEHKSKQYKKNT